LRYEEKGLQVTFETPETLPALPAAVEVAAYRIAQEALHNVARHAHARACAVRLDVGAGWLAVEVVDDGIGIPEGRHSGVGLQSMQERAAELNGRCRIEPRDGGGTRVWAKLLLYESPASGETGVGSEPPLYQPLAEGDADHVTANDTL
jgi:two-component system NarL family sensor kinase